MQASCCIPTFGHPLSSVSLRSPLSSLACSTADLSAASGGRKTWPIVRCPLLSFSPSPPFSNAGLTPPWSQSFHCHASGNLTMSFRANDRWCGSSLDQARVRRRRDCEGRMPIIMKIIKRFVKIIYSKEISSLISGGSKSAIYRKVSLNEAGRNYDNVERMRAQDQIYWQWLHGPLASPGAAAVCTFLPFFPFNRARERASGIIYKPVLFPKPCIRRRKRQ